MSLQTFFDNFALLADAPNGVAKLRELVLQLAVEGKLISQDSRDEPAYIMLDKIKAKQARLIREKKIKEIDVQPIAEVNNLPFTLPNGWQWTRLGSISQKLGAGSTPLGGRNVYQEKGVKFLRSQNVWNDGLQLNSVAYISEKIHQDMSGTHVEAGDILLNITGASIGRSCCVPDDLDEANVSQHVSIVRLINKQLRFFIHLCIISPYIQDSIMQTQVGISREGLSMRNLKEFVFPIPPLEEQKRIVAKVGELMRLCDELEARQQARCESRVRLNNATLAPFNNAASLAPGEFEQASVRFADNFDALYDSAETVGKLRSTILRLAVQGKLTPQDPNDEPASVLIASIKKEKARLFEEKSIKRDKLSLSIERSDIPFYLPDGWEWARIASVITLKSGSTLAPELELNEGQIPYLKVGDMNLTGNEQVITTSSRYVQRSPAIIKDIIPANSIIFPKRGGAIARNKKRLVRSEIVIDSNTMAMICHKPMLLEYLHLWFMTVDLWQLNSGTSVPQINNKDLEPLLIQVPPLAEQKRIVAKVNQLLALCDELETKLRQTEADSEGLMKAAVRDLLASVGKGEIEEALSSAV